MPKPIFSCLYSYEQKRVTTHQFETVIQALFTTGLCGQRPSSDGAKCLRTSVFTVFFLKFFINTIGLGKYKRKLTQIQKIKHFLECLSGLSKSSPPNVSCIFSGKRSETTANCIGILLIIYIMNKQRFENKRTHLLT